MWHSNWLRLLGSRNCSHSLRLVSLFKSCWHGKLHSYQIQRRADHITSSLGRCLSKLVMACCGPCSRVLWICVCEDHILWGAVSIFAQLFAEERDVLALFWRVYKSVVQVNFTSCCTKIWFCHLFVVLEGGLIKAASIIGGSLFNHSLEVCIRGHTAYSGVVIIANRCWRSSSDAQTFTNTAFIWWCQYPLQHGSFLHVKKLVLALSMTAIVWLICGLLLRFGDRLRALNDCRACNLRWPRRLWLCQFVVTKGCRRWKLRNGGFMRFVFFRRLAHSQVLLAALWSHSLLPRWNKWLSEIWTLIVEGRLLN